MIRPASRRDNRESLLARLTEAEETLEALRHGEVDALVVRSPGGEQVYTLHGAEEPYRNLVEQMREGAVVLSQSGDILYANARFAALVGEPLETVVGGRINRFMSDADTVGFTALLGSGNGTRRGRLITSDGAVIEVYLSLTTTVSSQGIDSLTLIVTDLTELVEARTNRDRAVRDSHTKDEFLATLAHELRTPLGAIRSAVTVLECVHPADDAAARARDTIARQLGHISHLVDDLLDVERVASGKIRLDRRPLDMGEMVRRAVAGFAAGAGLDRRLQVSAEPVWVEADSVRLEQIVTNIVTNAIKYTPPGGDIRVSLRIHGAEAVFSVEDTGAGIAPELLPAIFDMFVQGESTLDRAQGGLGIGLTLVRRLVELHGGTVSASSLGTGHGSTFTVRLPRVREAAAHAHVGRSLDRVTPRRVLLIEDSRDAREMFRLVLELAGHAVLEAADGAHGLRLVETEHPDVAIIDIGLPGIDGYEVARRIRERPNGRAMLLLALTGYGLPGDHDRSGEAGFDHHLVKPVDPAELTRLLEWQRGTRALEART